VRAQPKELLRLVFEVFGDQEVLDRYEQARSHQQQLGKEVEQAASWRTPRPSSATWPTA
jgi:hypothetical protein